MGATSTIWMAVTNRGVARQAHAGVLLEATALAWWRISTEKRHSFGNGGSGSASMMVEG